MDAGSNKSLYTLLTVIIFGIFLSMIYWFFQAQLKDVLASVIDGVKTGTVVNMEDTFALQNEESDFLFEPSTGTILGYVGKRKNIVIPDEIDGVVVEHIGDEAFYGGKQITDVVFPSSVKTIGVGAFREQDITNLFLPDTIQSIGADAFRSSNLVSVLLPTNLTVLESRVFYSTFITSIELPSTLKEIKDRALYGTPMTTITLPEGVTLIGDSAFRYSKLQGIRIPSTVTNIGTYAFNNTDIVNAEVPNSTIYTSNAFPATSVITKY